MDRGSPLITVRPEAPPDYGTVRRIHLAAFGGPDEASIVDRLRGAPGRISLVADQGSVVTGHILLSTARIPGTAVRTAALGPMAVHPSMQRSGIGSALVHEGVEACRRAGFEAVVLVGHAEFYPRFGFRRGSDFGLRCQFEVPDEVFMTLELRPGALHGGGIVHFAPAFGTG